MPTLNWIGKDAVVKHHKEVPFRLLEPMPELSCGTADSGNLIEARIRDLPSRPWGKRFNRHCSVTMRPLVWR